MTITLFLLLTNHKCVSNKPNFLFPFQAINYISDDVGPANQRETDSKIKVKPESLKNDTQDSIP